MMKTITKTTSPPGLFPTGKSHEETFFVRFLGICMQGLLSGNSFYDSEAMCSQNHHTAEELLENAVWFAERMVALVEERRGDRTL
jgi:hypothetical protein